MVNTPEDLYNAVLAFMPGIENTICNLHLPCVGHPMCTSPMQVQVLDFDAVEKKLATGRRSTKPSCDGITLNNDKSVFCFIEIKGWRKFIEYNIENIHTNISEQEINLIDQKAASYNLKGKLDQSIIDCEEITSQQGLFMALPYIYIIVSDIEEDKNAIGDIAANLSILAETTSVWKICDEKMIHHLNKQDATVRKVYTHCRDFDSCLQSIHL